MRRESKDAGKNPKYESRNPKQILNSNVQMFKTRRLKPCLKLINALMIRLRIGLEYVFVI